MRSQRTRQRAARTLCEWVDRAWVRGARTCIGRAQIAFTSLPSRIFRDTPSAEATFVFQLPLALPTIRPAVYNLPQWHT